MHAAGVGSTSRRGSMVGGSLFGAIRECDGPDDGLDDDREGANGWASCAYFSEFGLAFSLANVHSTTHMRHMVPPCCRRIKCHVVNVWTALDYYPITRMIAHVYAAVSVHQCTSLCYGNPLKLKLSAKEVNPTM